MAYSSGNLVLVRPSRDGAAPQEWSYISTDALSVVTASGYFTDAGSRGVRLGDTIQYSESDNSYAASQLTVSTIAAGVATVSGAGGLAVSAGVGITGGVGTVYKTTVQRIGDIIITRILIGLTGLNSGGTAGDIIGTNGTGVAYLGQITTARNGVVHGVRMTCLEAPTGGDADFDLYSSTAATGVEDVAISGLAGQTQIINSGAQAIGTVSAGTNITADHYLYLVGQGTANATYTAGRVLLEIFGY